MKQMNSVFVAALAALSFTAAAVDENVFLTQFETVEILDIRNHHAQNSMIFVGVDEEGYETFFNGTALAGKGYGIRVVSPCEVEATGGEGVRKIACRADTPYASRNSL